jgi:hypothetical protein
MLQEVFCWDYLQHGWDFQLQNKFLLMTAFHKKELWIELSKYHFHHLASPNIWNQIAEKFGGADASTKAFAEKISRKHSWKKAFALKAIHEYKKFIYLGVVSEFSVTPSKAIDTVWHEHLLFTKAYREFCDSIIHYNFEHHPELIAIDEQTENFAAQYVKTLQLYRYEFGYDAPVDIWDLPKFSREQLKSVVELYKEKQVQKNAYVYDGAIDNGTDNDAPLMSFFDTAEFTVLGGGDFGGAGAGGDISDSGSSNGSSCSSCSSGCSSCGGGD